MKIPLVHACARADSNRSFPRQQRASQERIEQFKNSIKEELNTIEDEVTEWLASITAELTKAGG